MELSQESLSFLVRTKTRALKQKQISAMDAMESEELWECFWKGTGMKSEQEKKGKKKEKKKKENVKKEEEK